MVDRTKSGFSANIKQNSAQLEVTGQGQGAFYIYQGTPQKQIKGAPEEGPLTTAPLFELDIKFDSLKSYLSNVSSVVNNHATLLNSLQVELKTRMGELNSAFDNRVGDCFVKFALSTVINDADLNKWVQNKLDKPKSENTGNFLEDSCNKFCNKLPSYGQAVSHVYTRIRELENRVTKTETDIVKKVDRDEYKAKVKKTKKKLNEKIDALESKHEKMIHDLEARFNGKISHFENRVNEVEKNTLWKIKDCEELLKLRVNDEYVIDAVKALEDKLLREFKSITEGENEQMQKMMKELKEKISKIDDELEEKTKSLKKDIKETESDLKKKLQNEKFDEYKKFNGDKIEELNNKIRDLYKRFDPPIEKLSGDMGGVNGKIQRVEILIKELNEKLELLDIKIDSKSNQVIVQEVKGDAPAPQMDLSKIHELEALIKRLRDELSRQTDKFNDLEALLRGDMSKKLDVSVYNLSIGRKIERDEVMKLLQDMQFDDDKYRQLLKMVDDLSRKFETISETIDKRFMKFRKELDLNTLFKQLKAKAEEDDVHKGFGNVDTKINALSDIINGLKKELESTSSLVRKLRAMLLKTKDGNSLISTKGLPLTCLSCGRGDAHFVPPVHYLKGNDGKLYRTYDSKTGTQPQEVDEYDVGIDYYADPKHSAHMQKCEHNALLNDSNGAINSTRTMKPRIDIKTERPSTAQSQTKYVQSAGLSTQFTSLTVTQSSRVMRPTSAKK